jgi:hypothetical protein
MHPRLYYSSVLLTCIALKNFNSAGFEPANPGSTTGKYYVELRNTSLMYQLETPCVWDSTRSEKCTH